MLRLHFALPLARCFCEYALPKMDSRLIDVETLLSHRCAQAYRQWVDIEFLTQFFDFSDLLSLLRRWQAVNTSV